MSILKSQNKGLNLKNPIHLLAFGFGSGLSPVMPGTIGTVVAIPLFILLSLLTPAMYIIVTCLLAVAGIYICDKTASDLGVHDHSGIVWDEIVGYLITMMFVPCTVLTLLLGFALFRVFDIWKPWPISWCDRHVQGGWGIMLDDLLAGAIAALVMQVLLMALALF